MGDHAENSRALEDVLGSIFPRHVGEWSPANLVRPDAFERFTTSTDDVWQRLSVRGFEVRVSTTTDAVPAVDAYVDVAFGNSKPIESGNTVAFARLRTGEAIEARRGFDGLWIRPHGGPLNVMVTADPLVRIRRAVPTLGAAALPAFSRVGTDGAAVASTPLADTGQLAAGDYEFLVWLGSEDNSDRRVAVQLRDATNSVNVFSYQRVVSAPFMTPAPFFYVARMAVALNQRFRLHYVATAVTGGAVWSPSIFYRRVA